MKMTVKQVKRNRNMSVIAILLIIVGALFYTFPITVWNSTYEDKSDIFTETDLRYGDYAKPESRLKINMWLNDEVKGQNYGNNKNEKCYAQYKYILITEENVERYMESSNLMYYYMLKTMSDFNDMKRLISITFGEKIENVEVEGYEEISKFAFFKQITKEEELYHIGEREVYCEWSELTKHYTKKAWFSFEWRKE